MTYVPAMVNAQVLYDNVLRQTGAVVTYSGAVVAGFEPINSYDWRDFSLFQPAASATLITELLASYSPDTVCIWWADAGSNQVQVDAWNGSSWVAVATVLQATNAMNWMDFTAVAGTKFRFTFNGTNLIRQITLGVRLQFSMGQWRGVAPPKLLHGVVMENVISVNGSILGRNLRRVTKEGEITLSHLEPAWVRASWDPFAIHASKRAFWWRWDPVNYPSEVGFTVAEKIVAPKNSSPPGRMETSMPIMYLS